MSIKKEDKIIKNTKTKDNGAKLIFDDPILCASFCVGIRILIC